MSNIKKTFFSRVDVQVSLITALTTLCASLIIAWIYYTFTLQASMLTLRNRTTAIYDSMEELIAPATFHEINTLEDMENPLYIHSRDTFLHIKELANVLYLYTAKRDSSGEFVYVIDGLNVTEDFRIPGDPIEPEIIDEMQRALDGEIVFPERIKNTSWGNIFVTYMPFHDHDGNTIGVLGIEFEANDLYDTHKRIFYAIPFISLFFCILSAYIAFRVFRRLSNPHFKDLATTDCATGLKNRNGYEIDFTNLVNQKSCKDVGIIAIDLDKLKYVNDQLGHNFGDAYIKLVADILTKTASPDMIIYRIGGDEFIVLVPNTDDIAIARYADRVSNYVSAQRDLPNVPASVSCGYAMYNAKMDKNLHDTVKRADALMYEIKRERHKWIIVSELAVQNIKNHENDLGQQVSTDILTACKKTIPEAKPEEY